MRPGMSSATEHVDAVVVGSGFGGAVSAFRLAEAGRSVVLLERGRSYPPGSFPRSPHEMGREFWDPEQGLRGLFDVWSFDGFESLVSSGLGGGSLIYANVLLRKDEKWFVREEPLPGGGYESWPVTRADLDPHYDAVERMLAPVPYPFGTAPFSDTPKTRALRDAAARLEMDWHLPPLAVAFASRPGAAPEVGATIDPPDYGNIHGLPRRTCRLDGGCDIGCNEGAKNSLDHTYLSAAAHHGADIRTLADVKGIRPLDGGGYRVDYLRRDPDDAAAPAAEWHVTADRLILGAGTYGTTHLLLRNRDALPGIGDALGTRFSGNGDLLTFLMPGEQERVFDASSGPVITSTIRVGDTADGDDGRGFYLQDGGYPGFVDWMVEPSRAGQGRRTAAFALDWLARRLWPSGDPRLSDEVSRLIGDGSLSAGSLPLLGMGRDVPDGEMTLADGRLDVQWTTATSKDYFARVRDTMSAIADELGVRLQDNPLSFFRRVVTVHPLGGAPMGRDPSVGVCDAHGQVFGHPGLYVADGAAMPGPVGPNPSLTIAAHADRVATGILAEPGRRPRPRTEHRSPGGADRADGGAGTSLSFTEEMRGYLAFDEQDPAAGEASGRALDQEIAVHLTITAEDVDQFLSRPAHLATVEGHLDCAALGGRLEVRRGWFNLFVAGDDPRGRRMLYRLFVVGPDGAPMTFAGHKDVRDDPGPDLWSDTTTLYARLLDGHVDAGAEGTAGTLGAGILRLGKADLLRQLTTFSTSGPDGAGALLRFGRFFLGELWDVYVGGR